jgi:hypothetical protein
MGIPLTSKKQNNKTLNTKVIGVNPVWENNAADWASQKMEETSKLVEKAQTNAEKDKKARKDKIY